MTAPFVALVVLACLRCSPNHGERGASSEHASDTRSSAVSWAPASPPIRIRAGHTATLLGTGEVLITGGGAYTRTTELLDPYGNTIALGPDMLAGRYHHTATLLLSGKVLVAGGTMTNVTPTAELYDPVTRRFSATGAMKFPRSGQAAVRLRSGKVLLVGSEALEDTAEIYDPATGTFTSTSARLTHGPGAITTLANGNAYFIVAGFGDSPPAEIFNPSAAGGAGAWSSTFTTPPNQGLGNHTVTRLRDGRIAISTTEGCAAVNQEFCFGHIELFDPAAGLGSHTLGPSYLFGRSEPTAALLPTGEVVYAGGRPDVTVKTSELYSTAGAPGGTLTADGATSSHQDATSVVLPGGDVLLIGGTQAAIDRRTAVGVLRDSTGSMVLPRLAHNAVRLHDGKLLVTGGDPSQSFNNTTATTEIFDPTPTTFADGGAMTVARHGHSATVLRSGKVLIAGGARTPSPLVVHASAEIYDPALAVGSRTRAVGSMATARIDHAAVLLPSGQVLVTGGCPARATAFDACTGPGATATAELFDPVTEKFTVLPSMSATRFAHGMVLLPTGKVLVIGGATTAELFDPVTKTFKLTTPSGSFRDGRTARVLPDGRVFVAGGTTFAPDIFDATTETWSFATPLPAQFPAMLWATRPDGRLVSSGGLLAISGLLGSTYMFDPLAAKVGATHLISNDGRGARHRAAMTLSGTGAVVVTGGVPCFGGCFADPSPLAALHEDGAPAAARPKLDPLPAVVVGGTTVTLAGTGFANGSEGSSGTHGSSATNHPLALWVADGTDAVISGTILDFTDTTATWLVPATAYHGHGMLFVSVGGVLSTGASVTIDPAAQAVACAYDAECAAGFCVDGVCCDRRCDGKCEGCSLARKTTGADGVCGAVPPGRDIAGRCFSLPGQACKDAVECATGFCAQGVCCDSTCTGECQSCNQESRAGICSPIKEGACGAACDGDHTLKQTGSPDVDCAPYQCEGPRCRTTCASVKDCVAPFVCTLDGLCAAPVDATPGEAGVCSCHLVGGTRRLPDGMLSLGVGLGLALLATARARRTRGSR